MLESTVLEPTVGQLLNSAPYVEFALRLGIDLLTIFVVVRVIYYPRHRNKDFFFTFFLFNVVNFLICFLLSSTKLNIGFAFGLFAIFSILRYRTVTVPIREMGYFFVCVTVGLLNALARLDDSSGVAMLVASNAIIVLLIWILERHLSLEHENVKEIVYERIDLIAPGRREEMLADLRTRTGLPIHRLEVIKVDFLRDVARLHAFYLSQESESTVTGAGGDDD